MSSFCSNFPCVFWPGGVMDDKLSKYEKDTHFLKLFLSSAKVCLIIHVFCRNCEPKIVFVLICTLEVQFHVHKSYKTGELALLCIGIWKKIHICLILIYLYSIRINFNLLCPLNKALTKRDWNCSFYS